EGGTGDASHPAMDVGEAASVDAVEDPGGDGRSDVSVQGRHRAGLDRARPARPHDELVALPEGPHEGAELAEVIGAVGVAHDHVAPADVWQRIDVCPAETAPWGLEDSRTT